MAARRAILLATLLAGALAAGCVDEPLDPFQLGAEIVRPGPIALASPAHAAILDGRQATFTWSFPSNATGWTARLLLDGKPVDECPFEAERTSCTLALPPAQTHRWAVEAFAQGDAPVVSSERALRTNAPPTPPRIEPGDEGTTQAPLHLRFSWAPARDPERGPLTYRVTVSNASGQHLACEATAEPACEIPWRLRAGETVMLTVWSRDAFGLESTPATVNVTAQRPVVLLHGWTGDETTWAIMAPELVANGFEVLDFDAAAPGLQLLVYEPAASNETIQEMAATKVVPKIQRALVDAGFAPDAPVDLIAHSMGGLVGRVLVEQQGHGAQFATLTMVGTPNRGSPMSGEWLCRAGPTLWRASCMQMEAGSPFLRDLGHAPLPPAGTAYATIGGGKDTMAPDRSVRLDGIRHWSIPNGCHSGTECSTNLGDDAVPLTGSREVLNALLEILSVRPGDR